jgi:hypothetical protein
VLLDVELKGVDQLGIRKDLSKPATYIVDPAGNLRYAYVGEHIADRPSVAALLAEVGKSLPLETSTVESSVSEDQPAASPKPVTAETSNEEPPAE